MCDVERDFCSEYKLAYVPGSVVSKRGEDFKIRSDFIYLFLLFSLLIQARKVDFYLKPLEYFKQSSDTVTFKCFLEDHSGSLCGESILKRM